MQKIILIEREKNLLRDLLNGTYFVTGNPFSVKEQLLNELRDSKIYNGHLPKKWKINLDVLINKINQMSFIEIQEVIRDINEFWGNYAYFNEDLFYPN